jgi:hypothetical protein
VKTFTFALRYFFMGFGVRSLIDPSALFEFGAGGLSLKTVQDWIQQTGFLFSLGGGAGEAIKITPFVCLKTPKPVHSFVAFFNQF